MGPNTWTIAGPAGSPVTFIVDDPEGKARIDPMPYASFSVGMPVTVEFEHVGEMLPDDANWAPMTSSGGNNWTANLALSGTTGSRSGRLFLRTTDATKQSSTSSYRLTTPTAVPGAPTLNSLQQTGTSASP